jgi:hypothetical protein
MIVLFFTIVNSYGQTDRLKEVNKKLFIGLGSTYSNFQDQKFSNVQFSGLGANIEIGFTNETEKHLWEVGLNASYSKEKAKTHNTRSTIIYPNLYFKYLRTISKGFSVGGRVDLIDIYFRNTDNLSNNGPYTFSGSSLLLSLGYRKTINENWKLQSFLEIGILGFVKESVSFGYSAPQNVLEDGDFSYTDDKLSDPLSYKYNKLVTINKNLNVRASVFCQYKKRFSVGYQWKLNHSAFVKSYPSTIGIHNIIVRFNIINKIK